MPLQTLTNGRQTVQVDTSSPDYQAYLSGGFKLPTETSSPRTLTPPTTLGNDRSLGLQQGSPIEFNALGGGTPTQGQDQSQLFGLKVMDLLKQYQKLGTKSFAQQGFNAQQEQINRLYTTSPDLIGASPSLQNQVRSASADALDPTIQGAGQGQRTFSEQIKGLGDSITQARGLIKDFEQTQNTQRDDARTTLNQALTTVGGSAFDNLDPVEVTQLEKIAGYPKGYLAGISKTLKERELELKRQTELERQQLATQKLTTKVSTSRISGGGIVPSSKLSQQAQAVIDGVLRLEDLTPTVRGKIAGELSAAGYKSGPKLTGAQQEDIGNMNTVNALIDNVLKYNENGQLEGVGGLFKGSIESFFTKTFGTGSEEAKNVRALLGNIRGTIAKLRGGTSFTANEEKLLNTYVPTINESTASIISKLTGLKQFIAIKNNALTAAAQERGVDRQQGRANTIKQTSSGLKYIIK